MGPGSVCCNILWVIFGGFATCLGWCIPGLILCITIIGIPAGVQCFKIGCFALCPFGRQIVPKEGGYDGCDMCLNIIWVILAGLWIAIVEGLFGVILCITIFGIPFGLQHFKIAKIAFMPFGSRILDDDAPQTIVVTQQVQQPIIVVNSGPQVPPPTQPGYVPPSQPY